MMTTDQALHGSGREPATVRVAMWSARHRWPVVLLWFVATIGTFIVSLSIGGINASDANENPNERKLEASEAYDVFNAGGTNDPFEQFIVVIGGGPNATTDPAFKTAVDGIVGQLRAAKAPYNGVDTPTFDPFPSPFEAPPEAGLVCADGTTVRIVARIPGDDTRVAPLIAPVRPILDAAKAANPDLTIHAISSTFINEDINELITSGLDDSLRLTIPLTFLILLFAFGAIVASVVPLVLAMTSLLAAFGILGIYSQIVGPVSPNATQLIVLIGLAVAVDYSLFMITRFRVERRSGRDRAKAIEISSSTAGRAVFFSGLAVMISLAGLLTLGVSLFTSMAIGTIGVVLVSVIGSLTFLPATLAILGDRVNLGRPATWLPRLVAALPLGPLSRWGRSALGWLDERASRPEGSGFWARLVTAVMARPVLIDGRVGGAPARARVAGPPPAHRASPTSPRSPTRSTASPGSSCSTRSGRRAPSSSSMSSSPHADRRRDAGRDRAAQDRRAEDRRAERSRSTCTPSNDGKVALVVVHDGRRPERRGEPRRSSAQVRTRARRRRSSASLPDVRTLRHRRRRVRRRRHQGLRRRRRRGSSCSCWACRSC